MVPDRAGRPRLLGRTIDWMRDRLLAEGMISAGDIDLLHVVDTPEEAVEIV